MISPLLANLYLHWFDVRFSRVEGPGQWAKAHLVRYADDFVILARCIDARMTRWVEQVVEGWLGLTVNRTKTRVLRLQPEPRTQVDFLGYTFRYRWDRFGRSQWYLTAEPSAKAVARLSAELRTLIGPRQAFWPLPEVVEQVNRVLRDWRPYFSFGYPQVAYRHLNRLVIGRFTQHLRRRSQRACRPPAGQSVYTFLTERLGLQLLARANSSIVDR